ncbi:MAG: enoyl-CoA hydratase/isomerase family protein [Acidimicrobiales bacterium]|nr:enoyl-CoA hydratase/isomerase family protein [Acidimicrobiales bacterium]
MAYITHEIRDGAAVITLNDPTKRNAINLAMNAEIAELLDTVEAEPSVSSIVVTGAPPAFCAGADLEDLLNSRHKEGLQEIYRGFLRIAHSPLPTIAAVNGPAIGAGMNYALACDIILAARSARFDCRFLQIGIHPGGGHTWRLREKVGDQAAKAMMLFGEVMSAEDAERIGLVWRCVDDADLMPTALAMTARCASFPKKLVTTTKATMTSMAAVTNSVDAVTTELTPQANSMGTPEFVQRVQAMIDKISGGTASP